MKKFLVSNLWSMWLGASIPAFTHIGIMEWQWWGITIPVMFFVVLKEKFSKEN